MLILEKTYYYFKQKFNRKFLYRFGFGSPVGKNVWEAQFEKGAWDYLYSDTEMLHYRSIVRFYKKYGNGTVLDVGCGQGVLFHYLKSEIKSANDYLGLDISDNAIAQAKNAFPAQRFEQMDFNVSTPNEKFDLVIFNECIYYFNKPIDQLDSYIKKTLNINGHVIVSVFYYAEHAQLWKRLAEKYQFLEMEEVINEKGQKWRICVFKL